MVLRTVGLCQIITRTFGFGKIYIYLALAAGVGSFTTYKMGSILNSTEAARGLLSSLSNDAQALIDPESPDFKESMKRWSDVGIKFPAAILKPGCEKDVARIV
jgi:hypothetical protein